MLNLFTLTSVLLFTLALHAFMLHPQFLRKIIALNIMSSALFLFFVVMARRHEEADAVAHALVLTGIVVALAVTAFALTLAGRIYDLSGETHLTQDDEG